MGTQCSIILSFYDESDDAERLEKEVFQKFGIVPGDNQIVKNAGNRAFSPEGLKIYFIAMKDWEEEECEHFFCALLDFKWQFPHTIQAYWQPAHCKNYSIFKLFNLID